MKNTPALQKRKELIKSIALRYRAENDFIKSVSVERKDKDDDQYTQIVEQEFEALQKSSVKTR